MAITPTVTKGTLQADEIRVSVENGNWVARFYWTGREVFVIRPDQPGQFNQGNVFIITGVRVSTDFKLA